MNIARTHWSLVLLLISIGLAILTLLGRGATQEHEFTVLTQSAEENATAVSSTSLVLFDREYTKLSDQQQPAFASLVLGLVHKQSNQGELVLSIDQQLQEQLYRALETTAQQVGYVGGAGVVMDIENGELLALVSYAQDATTTHKAIEGLYVPGSIVKPFVAIAALSEDLISPQKEILSTGAIELVDRNGQPLFFNDWKPHGYVAMREALGVSSNVYFYAVGGGYEDQSGLGIENIERYLRLFGIGQATGILRLNEPAGQLPTPAWKEKTYQDEWRVGDTYLAAIGQHGYAVTPLQMTRAVAAIGNGGYLITPRIVRGEGVEKRSKVPVKPADLAVVQAGMEYAVTNGTAAGLYYPWLTLAAKTGTAEVDTNKTDIHSWLIGYWPHDKPRYAFTIFLEQGPWGEETGAVAVASDLFGWMRAERLEYLRPQLLQ